VLALGAIVACLSLLIGALQVAQAVATGHRAAAAADLAALAGAQEASANVGPDHAPCRAAARVAALNGTSLDACVEGSGATVTVWVSAAARGPWPRRAVARSRAGPGGKNDFTSETAPEPDYP